MLWQHFYFAAPAHATALTPFAENVLIQVVSHEIGHAFIREFDIPVLANKEIAADAFALAFLYNRLPDRLLSIVRDRVISLRIEDDREDDFSEYPDDAQRVAQTVCLFYALHPVDYGDLARELGIGEFDGDCADRGTEIARSWRRILGDNTMPEGLWVSEAGISLGADTPALEAVGESDLPGTLYALLASIDWPSQINLVFDTCNSGAAWSRNGREITICDTYIERFIAQTP